TLSQLFQRVIITATGNISSTSRPATGPTGAPAVQGQFGQPGQVGAGQPQGTLTINPTAPVGGAGAVVLLQLPRFNAILMSAPKARIKDVIAEIKRLDQPIPAGGQAVPFPLKKASAARVDTFLNNWYLQRYPNETATQHQIRITHDDSTNTVYVQAAPADLTEIRELIERLDTYVSPAVNDIRVVILR